MLAENTKPQVACSCSGHRFNRRGIWASVFSSLRARYVRVMGVEHNGARVWRTAHVMHDSRLNPLALPASMDQWP